MAGQVGGKNTASEWTLMQLRPGLGRFCAFDQNMLNCWIPDHFGGKRETEGKRILGIVYGSTEVISFHLDGAVGAL